MGKNDVIPAKPVPAKEGAGIQDFLMAKMVIAFFLTGCPPSQA